MSSSPNPPALQGALYAAMMGLAIVPLQPATIGDPATGKAPHPMIRPQTWRDVSTTNFGTIRAWHKKDPNVNFGVDTRISGVLVLDFDDITQFNRFESDYGTLTRTLAVRTGRGVHLYYRPLQLNVVGDPHKFKAYGVDVKGSGYVVAPGSLHHTGARYEVISW